MTSHELEAFTFEIYNSSGSGVLTRYELTNVLRKIHGKQRVDAKLQAVLEIMDVDRKGGVRLNEYLGHIHLFPVLVFPVFAIQVWFTTIIIIRSFVSLLLC